MNEIFSITVSSDAYINMEFSAVHEILEKLIFLIIPIGLSGTPLRAEILIGSPFPHQSPVCIRVSIRILAKLIFWIDPESRTVRLIPQLES